MNGKQYQYNELTIMGQRFFFEWKGQLNHNWIFFLYWSKGLNEWDIRFAECILHVRGSNRKYI